VFEQNSPERRLIQVKLVQLRQGSAPSLGSSAFSLNVNSTVYYLLGTTGWGETFAGRPTALWKQ
jgi:hypothetical protein